MIEVNIFNRSFGHKNAMCELLSKSCAEKDTGQNPPLCSVSL
jgi:hypothetical protein